MPFYNHIKDWHGYDIEVQPSESWRKRISFFPYFVGQTVRLELRVRKIVELEDNNLQFHLVEKMADVEKPRMITHLTQLVPSSRTERLFSVQDGSRITGKGEMKYWLSTRGYNVDFEPIFSAEAINLDTIIIPIILTCIGPLLGILCGLLLGLLLS